MVPPLLPKLALVGDTVNCGALAPCAVSVTVPNVAVCPACHAGRLQVKSPPPAASVNDPCTKRVPSLKRRYQPVPGVPLVPTEKEVTSPIVTVAPEDVAHGDCMTPLPISVSLAL